MSVEQTVTHWISSLKEGDQLAVDKIWQRYFDKLCRLARQKLPDFVRREFDEEDVALSAIECLYRGLQNGKYPLLNDRNNLWSLLVVITARKVSHKLRDRTALKRGGKRINVERLDETGFDVVSAIAGREPTPEFAAEVADEAENMLAQLNDPKARKVAELKMAGYSNDEISLILDCGKRTVERKLAIIRRCWTGE